LILLRSQSNLKLILSDLVLDLKSSEDENRKTDSCKGYRLIDLSEEGNSWRKEEEDRREKARLVENRGDVAVSCCTWDENKPMTDSSGVGC